MSIWFYLAKFSNDMHFDRFILFDGENTYWIDEMKPSRNYTLAMLKKGSAFGKFIYMGEL